jgi:hypothetical protein
VGPEGRLSGWLKVARLARPSWREAAVAELQGLALGDRFWREGGSSGPACGWRVGWQIGVCGCCALLSVGVFAGHAAFVLESAFRDRGTRSALRKTASGDSKPQS